MTFTFFVFGLLVGSFLNVLADRLPKGQNVLWGRSRCDHCHRTLRWFELIPVVSYVLQGARCIRCHKTLSIQYPIIELITGLGFVYLPMQYWIIFSSLLVIFVSDLKYQIIPDSMVLIAAIASFLNSGHFLTGLASMAFFWTIWRITRGRGMGFGDVKLAGALGLLLGFPLILFALYAAFLTGAVVGVILMITGRKTLKSKIAFGPFLVLGTALAFVLQTVFLNIWTNLF